MATQFNTTKIKFGDEGQDTTIRELAEYVWEWLMDECKGTDEKLIEEALEAFYGGARNEKS